MTKVRVPEITVSEQDTAYLRSLADTSKLAAKSEYLCTFSGRFVVCYEVNCGKFIYYAVDQITGRFSYITEQSFKLSPEAITRSLLRELVKAVWYTGCFNRVKGGGKIQKTIWTTASRA